KLNKNNVYFIRLNQQAKQILMELEIFEVMLHELSLPKSIKVSEQKARSYLRGAFLARGSVNSPETHSYHLEIHSNDKEMNEDNFEGMKRFDLNSKMHDRRNE